MLESSDLLLKPVLRKEYKFIYNNSLTDRTAFSSECVIARMAINPAVSIAVVMFCRASSKSWTAVHPRRSDVPHCAVVGPDTMKPGEGLLFKHIKIKNYFLNSEMVMQHYYTCKSEICNAAP